MISIACRLPFKLLCLTMLAAPFLAACGEEATAPEPLPAGPRPVGVVLGSVDLSLTVFPVDTPTVTRTVGLGPAGTPVSLAARGSLAAVPLGIVPAVAVVDLDAGTVLRTIGLPEGSGATGIDFVNDSMAVVANPGLGTVTSVNVRSGSVRASAAVGVYPQYVLSHQNRVFVVNANLVNFTPAGPGSVTVLDAASLAHVAMIPLSGVNSAGIALGPDGLIYVVNSGNFGQGDGSLSVVSPTTLREIAHHEGFGDFPGPITFGPDGTLYTSSFSYGVVAWNPGSRTFVRGPGQAIAPGGTSSTAGLATDALGRLYTLAATCTGPDQALRLGATYLVEVSIPVGICPTDIEFSELPGG